MADLKFGDFLGEFIHLWETQLEINWDGNKEFSCMSDEGPHLSLLPDEFLPSLDRQLFQLKAQIENGVNGKDIETFIRVVKALVIVSRNLDNIPFIASCQLIPSCISISSNVLTCMANDRELGKDEVTSVVLVCLFLEALYDPYFSYRKSIFNQTVDTSKIKYQPALLQAELIPFIYDCFQHLNATSIPVIAYSLLNLFGGIIKGAQHNAAKAIAPATVQLLQKAFLNSNDNLQLASAVLHCETTVVHTLMNMRPDQCQIEVGEVMEIYQNTVALLASQEPELLIQISTNRTPILCLAVKSIAQFLRHRRRESLQILLVRTGVVDFLIMLLFDAKLCPEDKRVLVVSIVKALTAILQDNKQAQEMLLSSGGYQKFFEAIKSLGQPTRLMMDSLIAMAIGRDDENGEDHESMVRNVEPIAYLVDWLPEIADHELQFETALAINKLCSSSLQSKAICCQRGLLRHVISVLEFHSKLNIRSVKQMLRLIQSLGSHSITASELKLILRLMRDTDGEEFPYSSYILHCLSSMAKKDAACQECHYYFDIQYETEGIMVTDIAQWQNSGYALSICTWLRLDALENPSSIASNYRRQLFNLSSNKGHGFEAFFLSDGTLVVGVTWKKEYTTAMVHSVILNDHQWHSVCISFIPSRRIFGQSHLSVFVDGTLRLTVNVRIPPVSETFSSFTIGAPVILDQDSSNKQESNSVHSLPRKKSDVRSPGLSSHIPNYFSLPIALSSLKSPANEQQTDPEVRVIPQGSQDSIWGKSTCLHGQIGLFAVLQDSLNPQNVRTFHEAGANNMSIWSSEDPNLDVAEFYSKVAICLSARAYHNSFCMDLSSTHQFGGITKAPVCSAWDVKEVLSCIGGVQALFPILDTVVRNEYANTVLTGPLLSPDTEKPDVDGWEVLPSSSYADWKLEQNPVSGFLSLLRNVLHHHSTNTDQLVRGANIAIIGSLMQKVQPSLIDVQVLMAVQLLVEFARDAQDPSFLQSLYQHILFDMRIWCRSQFHVRIGHVQYLSNLIHEDRLSFRKKYGPQYLLDVIKQHYQNSDQSDLSIDDRKTMRQALLGILKMYINKEITANDISAITGFLWSVRDNEMITEMLDVLLTYVENKNTKDQFYLLLLEPRCAEILYALLLEKIFSVELREKVLKLLINILKTDRAYEKSKLRLYLHDVGFQGLLMLMQGQPSSLEMTHLLTDIILSRDHPNSYTGAMALAFSLAEENLEIKLEFSKRLLGFMLSRPNAPSAFVKQTSWQECIARLLIRKPIAAATNTGIKPMVPDLIDLDVEAATYRSISTPVTATTPLSPSKAWPTTPSMRDSSGLNLGLSATLEQDIKDVAESVSNLVAGAVTGNLNNIAIATGNLQNAAEVLTDNLHNVAGNLQTNIHSAVNSAVSSAYSLFRQKTLQVQGSLEELGENTIQRLKRRSQSAQGAIETTDAADAGASTNSSPRLKHPYRFLVAPLEVAVDALNIDQSDDDVPRSKHRESSLSISSRTSGHQMSKNFSEFGPHESLDVETYSLISEVSGQWSGLVLDPTLDPEEDLCSTVLSIYLVLLWRGIPGCSKEDWRERSQILSCINLLGLNNELYRSHLEIKRRLIEIILQVASNELKQLPANAASRNNVLVNCQYAIRWVYDLVVLDPHEDEAKKMSLKLLELTLAIFDIMDVFREEDFAAKKSTEMYHIALGLLLRFASSSSSELCAIASARLHALIQFRSHPEAIEVAYLIFNINSSLLAVQGSEDDADRYSCLIPIMKAALEKGGSELEFESPCLTLSANLFDEFRVISQGDAWKTWIDDKIRPKSDLFRTLHLQALPEIMNRSWAESDESAMLAVHRRCREVNESKIKFQMQILDAFRSKQSEEHVRFNALLSHQRGHALVIRKKWRQLKQFLIGPRGSWAQRVDSEKRWKLSLCENRSRMRLKLIPNQHFDPHIQASRLRDNAGIQVDVQSQDSLNCLLPSKVANQVLKRAFNAQEPEDSLTEEDLALAASLEKEELNEGKEKVTTSEDCELVTLMSVIKGRLEISRGWICFWDAGLGCESADRERVDFKFALSQLQEVHLRRYNLRRSALEFFLIDHTTYFVNFNTKTRNRIYSRILSLRPPNLLYYSSRSPADVLRSSGLTQRWVQREISNFDYLMQLNTIAGRTYNDLSQYPVFPWILADYQSETLDLTKPTTFRDLSRPIGVVNPKNAKEVRAKYDQFEDPSGIIAKFHYGTHYSNAAGVLHYLVRMEPFTSLHIELQSGRFDVADRQFHSLNSTWRLLMDNPNDVKELIPEFFCQPEFLINMNRLDLGILQATKQPVDHVELPPWAKSPHDFIDQHRKALESDYVSAHLHEWIDLIFGYKQRGPAAVEALNVFYYCSYEGAVDLDSISDPVERQAVEGMINHFGQTPCQLFKEPHPMRLSQSEALAKSKYPPSMELFFDGLSCVHIADLTVEPRDSIVYLSIPNSDIDSTRSRGYGSQAATVPDMLVSVSRSGCIGLHAWASHDKMLPYGFSLERDPTLSNPRNRRRISESFHPSVKLNSRLISVSSDCKVYVGGQLDNSIKVYALPRLRLLSSVTQHIDIVTCLALDESGSQLITGSRDTTCIVWDLSSSVLKSVQVLYGHDKTVTCVGLSTSLDMAVSGSLDGTVNVHTIKEGQYIRTLHASGRTDIERIIITQLWLSDRGDVVFSAEEKDNFSIQSYSINGEKCGLSYSPYAFTALSSASDGYVACGDSNGNVTIRRIISLVPVFDIPMQSPIEDLVMAPRNTQLLVALRDGKVVVVAPNIPQ
ncbi:putative neurobeachin-like protein 1-like isoform X3 [Daphnia sinensis]|uniref:Neurobeachin-like protein 1-like isoform X3 n=1 Tax=Daphnia sinensis TaxID=1820382 RepID=A0AAD5KUB1_9CRUS|nr:putative neurobeachin-like protein 1-like isoform X3 [Daphnia sinensis]